MILKYPHKLLRTKSLEISKITPEIKKIAKKMIQEMQKKDGAGLAANQIGHAVRMICYMENEKPKILINPEICKSSQEKKEAEEGCLSFPNLFGQVVRSKKVMVKGKDLTGKNIKIPAKDLLAVVFQHEIDHLNGVVFIDKVLPKTLHKVKPEEKKPGI